jgi:hypothetical protein
MYVIAAQLNLWNSTGNWIIEESAVSASGVLSVTKHENLTITTEVLSNFSFKQSLCSLVNLDFTQCESVKYYKHH